LAERLHGVQEAAGSNPVTPTFMNVDDLVKLNSVAIEKNEALKAEKQKEDDAKYLWQKKKEWVQSELHRSVLNVADTLNTKVPEMVKMKIGNNVAHISFANSSLTAILKFGGSYLDSVAYWATLEVQERGVHFLYEKNEWVGKRVTTAFVAPPSV
jgi:frataxin-like iron-binding protein CyaY